MAAPQRASITISRRLAMPDLSNLTRSRLLTEFMFWSAFLDLPISGHAPTANLKNFVRLVHKSIREYELARASLTSYNSRPDNAGLHFESYVDGVNHLETCINALHRAFAIAAALQNVAPSLRIQNAELPRDAEVGRVRRHRHAFEHTPDFLTSGEISIGDTVLPRVWPEGIEFVGDEIRFDELARWLTKLHALAKRLSDLIGQAPQATT